jgi:cytochrome P450
MTIAVSSAKFAAMADRRRPPAPEALTKPLGPLALYRALRTNVVSAWRQEAYEEPYIADRNLLGGFVLLADPDLIRHVLVDNAANYPKDDLQLEKLEPAVGRGLLTADGEAWRLQRRTVAPLFQPQSVERYLTPMAASVDEMLARWAAHAQTGAVIDVAHDITSLTYDIISRTVFSHEIETPPEVMGEAITTYFDALGRIDLWDVLPLPRWLPRPAFIRAKPAQKIFREEVRRLLARLADTRMILEEAMRLYPPVPFMSREARSRDQIGEVTVAAGTRIIIAPWVLHRHRKLWPDADMFAPERFAPQNRGRIPRFANLPFGAGPRICVGATFAMQEALLALTMIARRFRLTLAEGAEVMPFARMTLRPMHGLPMRVEKRNGAP